jgi:hypothetical protein
MYSDLTTNAVQLHHDDLLREAERARLAAQAREPHPWRRRTGAALIRAGRRLAGDPAETTSQPRARVA